jgi:hypothetical protein
MAAYELPDLPYDYGHWNRTSPARSWSCTTTSTTHLRQGVEHRTGEAREARESESSIS